MKSHSPQAISSVYHRWPRRRGGSAPLQPATNLDALASHPLLPCPSGYGNNRVSTAGNFAF